MKSAMRLDLDAVSASLNTMPGDIQGVKIELSRFDECGSYATSKRICTTHL